MENCGPLKQRGTEIYTDQSFLYSLYANIGFIQGEDLWSNILFFCTFPGSGGG